MDEQRTPAPKEWPHHGRDPGMPRLLGGRLCLDFVNTVEDRRSERPVDVLTVYDDLVHWGWHAGILGEADAAAIRAEAARRPVVAGEVFAWAVRLRTALDAIFHAVAAGHRPRQGDLDAVMRAYTDATRHAHLAPAGAGAATAFAWTWSDPSALDAMLWPVARSAVEVLTSDQLERVKVCADPTGCDWLFLDTSKNRSRRWCSMEGCGSRAKMRRLYARQRAGTGGNQS